MLNYFLLADVRAETSILLTLIISINIKASNAFWSSLGIFL